MPYRVAESLGTIDRMPPAPSPPLFGPWFRRHPRSAAVLSAALFAAVMVLRVVAGDERDATGLLFVLPIALVAQAFGFRAGTFAASAGMGLLALWVVADGVELSVLGWAARMIPLLMLGMLIGHASDVQRHAEALATHLAVAEERQREAAEINDTIVQSLSVAKWKLEAGDVDAGIDVLDETIHAGQGLVASLLGGLSLSNGERRRSRSRVSG